MTKKPNTQAARKQTQLSPAHQHAVDMMPPLPAILDVRKRKPQTAKQKKLDADFRRDDGGAARTHEHDAASQTLNSLSPEGREWVEQEIAARRFYPHWLLDKTTITFIETDMVAQVRQRAIKRDEALARLHEREQQKPKEPIVPGYKGHRRGSRKERVHEKFDQEGADAAIKLATKLGLKDGTAASWAKAWAKESNEDAAH